MDRCVVQQPWTVVSTDVMSLWSRTALGSKYLVVFEYFYTRWIGITPMR